MKAWLVRHQTAVLYVGLAAVFVLTVWLVAAQRASDGRQDRERSLAAWQANVRFCESGNDRTSVLRDFLLGATADPDPRQYEFITDPQLRQGAIESGRRGRAEMRDRVNATFTLRNCAADFPAPPN